MAAEFLFKLTESELFHNESWQLWTVNNTWNLIKLFHTLKWHFFLQKILIKINLCTLERVMQVLGEETSQISNFVPFPPLTVKSSEYTCLKVYLVQTTKLKLLIAFLSEMIWLWKVKYVDELQVTVEHVISSSLRCVHITLSHNNLTEKNLTQMSILNLISRFEVTLIVRTQSVTDNSYILHFPPRWWRLFKMIYLQNISLKNCVK